MFYDPEFVILKGIGMGKRFEFFSRRLGTYVSPVPAEPDSTVRAIAEYFRVSTKVARLYKQVISRSNWVRIRRATGIE